VTPKSKKLPSDVIAHWPEIFNDIELNVIPIKYLHTVRVEFIDGKIWDIDIARSKSLQKNGEEDIQISLLNLFESKKKEIKKIDFKIDTIKIKKDIQKRTTIFMKKRK